MGTVLCVIGIVILLAVITFMLLTIDEKPIHPETTTWHKPVDEYDALASEAEYVKRAREHFDNPKNLRECQ